MKAFWRILTFRAAAFRDIKNDQAGFGTTLKIFVVVALIAALGQLLALRGIRQEQNLSERISAAAASMQARAQGTLMPALIADPLNAAAQWLSELSQVLQAGQPPLGNQLSGFLNVIGGWLASPFSALAVWLPGAVLLFVCARLLRGSGSSREHLSLVLLAFSPQILLVAGQLGLLPGLHALSSIFAVVAWFWSLGLLVFSLMQAHDFTAGRSIGTLLLAIGFTALAGTVVALFGAILAAGMIRLLT